MAFGGSGFSFGGNNNNQQSSGFGSGFGSNSNSGFGASTTNTGFGSSTTNSNPFGGGTSTFGSNNTTFGSNTTTNNNNSSSLFGNKSSTPFGSTPAAGGLFGSNNNTTPGFGGSGGFGSTNTSTGFGSNTNTGTGGFSFGSNSAKPAFGSASGTTPLFGQGGTGTTGGFGSTTSGFGSNTATALNQPVPPSDGTASTPFSPTIDKEANNTTNNYQSITFQQPYQKYSFEELRLGDYNAGRRFGNGSGQAGAFGNSSFGGFGSTGTGFGNTNASSNPFGTPAATTSTGFGSNTATTFGNNNTSGGLFGSSTSKPGGLFGQTTSSGTTGGLFGTSGTGGAFGSTNATGGFGSTNNNSTSTGGLFGNNQAKPGGLFGNTQSTGSSLFGNTNNNQTSTTNTSGGLFGNTNSGSTGGGLFGNTQQTTNTGGGLFGNTNNQQQKPGGLFGGGGFGNTNTQNQPSGGLFGNTNNATTNTTGGLFGNNNAASTGNSLFGNAGNTNTGGGLFGNNNNNTQSSTSGGLFGNANQQNQNKPGGLFGTSTSGGGGLFGNTNTTNTNTSGGLFGNNTASTGGGLFSNSQSKPSGGLFGNSTTNTQGGGLFGSTNNGGGLFGTSQNNQQAQQQQQDGVKHASLLDPNPYGQSSIWTGLPAASPENSKPVFTPLTASQKLKESMMKPPPSLRLNQSRYMTPPRRNGYGFSYSTYGTPNSATSTPGGSGLSGSMYGGRGWSGGSFGRSFNKSASVQNLRAQFTSDSDEIWKPGAFASSGRHSSGSIKRLTIDRSIRNDLFSRPTQPALPAPPAQQPMNGVSNGAPASQSDSESQQDTIGKLKKRVSFDNNATGSQLNGETGALVRADTNEEEERRTANGDASSRGNELAVVPEDQESNHISVRATEVQAKADPKPGDYWMKPSRLEMSKIPREKLQKFKDFQVGRYGCGQVTFNGTVDLTSISLDDLFDKIVEIRVRSVTVYPDASSKPPVGKGLNVPSTIAIENSWPRARNQPSSATSGPVFDKHINRLKKMGGTEFVDYEVSTGVWTFRVPHYTKYGLDYDEDDDDDSSDLSAPPDSIEKSLAEDSVMEVDLYGYEHSGEDDTFAFKQAKGVPGGFGRQSIIDYDYEGRSSALAPSSRETDDDLSEDNASQSDDNMSEDEPSMAGAYPAPTPFDLKNSIQPILKASGTPAKPLLILEGDWVDQLQHTISPRKQNRDALRQAQSKVLLDRAYSPIKPKAAQKSFRNSVDVMSSIFGKYEESRISTTSKGASSANKMAGSADFEFPYAKRSKLFDNNLTDMSQEQRDWLQSFRARFDGLGALVFRRGEDVDSTDAQWKDGVLLSEGPEAVVRSGLKSDPTFFDVMSQLASSKFVTQQGAPYVRHDSLPFSYLNDQLKKTSTSGQSSVERDLYNLAHVLFDNYDDEYTLELSAAQRAKLASSIRHDRLTEFLSTYILRKYGNGIAELDKKNPTAAAVLKLTAHDIKGACDSLESAKNYKLMLLVSQLEGASESWQNDIKSQLDAWRDQGVLSEMNLDVRALYEICSGNVTISQGKSAQNIPVEDKAATFAISEEFELEWLQVFALGLWFGRDEKRASMKSKSKIEDAVAEFAARCERGEESTKPGEDVMWAFLQVYAGMQGTHLSDTPVFPGALNGLNSAWDSSRAFRMHFALSACITGLKIDHDKADELAALFAWQSSSRGDLAGAIYGLWHLRDSETRVEMVRALLERFAAQLPDPQSSREDTTATELWTIMTQQLMVPTSWIYTAKAAYARAVDADGHRELRYLVAAESWELAHECFTRRVAPGCIVDADYDALANFVSLFGDDIASIVPEWVAAGGVYADFVQLSKTKGKMDSGLIDGLAQRLVDMGRKFNSDGTPVDLGKLPIEDLEERVAVREMSGIVAEYMGSAKQKEILELPITSDLRLKYTVAIAGDYYRSIMAGGDE